jgi:hypothetical protein
VELGYGCGPTDALVDKLQYAQTSRAASPTDYGFTIVTDHGNYDIPRANVPTGSVILGVDREFVSLQISRSPTDGQWERCTSVYAQSEQSRSILTRSELRVGGAAETRTPRSPDRPRRRSPIVRGPERLSQLGKRAAYAKTHRCLCCVDQPVESRLSGLAAVLGQTSARLCRRPRKGGAPRRLPPM